MSNLEQSSLYQLTMVRFRLFWREPEAIFWVYCFPLLLAVVLGLAFSGRAPDPPDVDVEHVDDARLVQDVIAPLKAAKFKVEVFSKEACPCGCG